MNNFYGIYIDFDGTITSNDVGYEMFMKFTHAATESLVQSYRLGEINSLKCLSAECDLWNIARPSVDEVHAFLDSQKLRSGFVEFISSLDESGVKSLILSEGFDFYIDRILASNRLTRIERLTNFGHYQNGILAPEFPYRGLGCGECSNCKGYHINRLRPAMSCAVYIGDGHSDLHAARTADIVFARSHLLEFLSKSKRPFIRFDDFFEINDKFDDIVQAGLFAQSEKINFVRFSDSNRRNIRALWENGLVMRYVGFPDGLGWSQAKFDSMWPSLRDDPKALRLALENNSGRFLGEAMISSPGSDGFCQPDLKLLPEFWGKGLAYEAWQTILERSWARWPEAGFLVTPNIENSRAIDLYKRLGFEFDGEEQSWQPSPETTMAVPIRYRRMVKKNVVSDGFLY